MFKREQPLHVSLKTAYLQGKGEGKMHITKLWFHLCFLSVALQHSTQHLKDACGKKAEILKAGALESVEKISFGEC